jgi:hypothetical protein
METKFEWTLRPASETERQRERERERKREREREMLWGRQVTWTIGDYKARKMSKF